MPKFRIALLNLIDVKWLSNLFFWIRLNETSGEVDTIEIQAFKVRLQAYFLRGHEQNCETKQERRVALALD